MLISQKWEPAELLILAAAQIAPVLDWTLNRRPEGATHRNTRSLAQHCGLGHMSVRRIRRACRLHPDQVRSLKLCPDPEPAAKPRGRAGLELSPREKALVLTGDEKSQVQALNRIPPVLPLRSGIGGNQVRDSAPHETTTLFAALDVLTG